MQLVQMIIHNICTTRTSAIEFLCKSKKCWCARKQIGPKATLVNLVFIEELEEDNYGVVIYGSTNNVNGRKGGKHR
jgi:hypothetical protein